MNDKVSLAGLASVVADQHYNEKIFSINEHCLRLAVNENQTFDWHRHNTTDELFIVLEGKLTIEFENGDQVDLLPNDSFCVKAGVIHRTIAVGRTVNLCLEKNGEDTEFVTPKIDRSV